MVGYWERPMGSRAQRARSVVGVRTLTAECRSGGSGGTHRRPPASKYRSGVVQACPICHH